MSVFGGEGEGTNPKMEDEEKIEKWCKSCGYFKIKKDSDSIHCPECGKEFEK